MVKYDEIERAGALQIIQFSDIDSFANFVSPWNSSFGRTWLFRGQSNAAWGLVPNVQRQPFPTEVFLLNLEFELLELYVRYADEQGLAIPGDGESFRNDLKDKNKVLEGRAWPYSWPPESFLQPLASAQHYGVPTRLLDWTRDPYVAAFFAAQGALKALLEDSDEESIEDIRRKEIALWAFNTCDRVFQHEQTRAMFQVVQVPGFANPNIVPQKGAFTVARSLGKTFEEMSPPVFEELFRNQKRDKPIAYKMLIPAMASPRLLLKLDHMGINPATLFPGYDGAAQATKLRHKLNEWERYKNADPLWENYR